MLRLVYKWCTWKWKSLGTKRYQVRVSFNSNKTETGRVVQDEEVRITNWTYLPIG